MARGLDGLATVAATAPFLGLLGAVSGIFGSFRGTTGPKLNIMAAMANDLSRSMIPLALGLAVATLASAGYRYLHSCLADFDIEMSHAARFAAIRRQ
jgi:biopolymer transport protein ExbB/TolQ